MAALELIINNPFTVITLIIVGMFAGLLAGLFGVGGGIVVVPAVFFSLQSDGVSAESAMVIATATSLATIVPTSISAIRSHSSKGNVDFSLLKRWLVFVVFGVMAGTWLITRVDGRVLTSLFGVMAMLAALNMGFRTKKTAIYQQLPSVFWQAIMATLIGFLSTLVGIGGGTLSVPLLTFCNYPAHRAVGTASAIGLVIALPSAIILFAFTQTPAGAPTSTLGLVNMLAFFCIVPFSILFAPVGVAIGQRMDTNRLKKAFAYILALMGVRMFLQFLF